VGGQELDGNSKQIRGGIWVSRKESKIRNAALHLRSINWELGHGSTLQLICHQGDERGCLVEGVRKEKSAGQARQVQPPKNKKFQR